ncbi:MULTISPECIES: mechanosensitive ion channel family protein [unclassified Actinomyces]|uniref:mechanosensitive ion channel family protein n=1 Tax=unclassified Actinomyces TaxID=2609248 RepID=UPI00201793DE|nr:MULTISPECIES: mechanosensitive ion channel family protein [unclassified Actinomyces]MCL3777739.1 mechanosensitive ion channel family protein [Actinomyces sp. AC-20-1]MCL3790456.1 mechanosensitive ion channel family protein [Actinomyces sp. 187325]MCL3792915.1 mechanosensitive ion channel family protein [Actinomyces sp. 186855]MCL3795212.1 mechanosensitive ion channel family protein [Actinomyces sp. 217892]
MSTPTPTADAVEAVAEATEDVLGLLVHTGVGALVGLVLAVVLVAVLKVLGHRRSLYGETARFARTPLYALGALAGGYTGAVIARLGLALPAWSAIAVQLLLIGVILAGTAVATALLKAVESSVVTGVRTGGDQGRANRVTTQAQVLRRVAQALVIVCGLVGAAMTFPSARLAMGSLLASAGLVSVVAGLAAQSTLGNVFAGIQLAVTDAIRVDDVVLVGTDRGVIEEITLTYVVVRVWDGRRLIYPSSYFTQNPFENWSRHSTEYTGTVELDLDWRVPVSALRAEALRVIQGSQAWDGRTADVDVTGTSGGTVTVRVAISAADAGGVWSLQCLLREELVRWLQREAPYALPRTRVEIEQVEVSQDPQPEQVARLAEELAALQRPGDAAEAPTAPQESVDADPVEAARLRAAARGRSPLRRARRDKVRRRRILARQERAEQPQREEATVVISTAEQDAYLEARKGSPATGD